MAVAAYGLKVYETSSEVHYEVRDDPVDSCDGVLYIDKGSPTTQWGVSGEGTSRALAAMVAARAYEIYRRSGKWPELAYRVS